ncbi:MAG: flagellar protein export ATPase FliI [Alphaproteobacteria bacterium]|nr:flagellar protein export ATPase FliI [Alphaproteobacteria bacterium]
MTLSSPLHHLIRTFETIAPYTITGKITDIQGMSVMGSGDHQDICIGSSVTIAKNNDTYHGEVIALKKNRAVILLARSVMGLSVGDLIIYARTPLMIAPNLEWKGRVINSLGEPLDDKGSLPLGSEHVATKRPPLPAPKRLKLMTPLDLGIRSLNAFTTACKGQRLGIFAGSGVGKSVLLSMLARYTNCDVCVIGLIGERGREVREFIEDTLGAEGLQKSVMVLATSDEPPLARRQAAYTTLTIAEYFRDLGLSVLCIIDSVTRFAMAQREIGLSAGEPPTTKGYPPSTFFELAQLCERAGPGLETDTDTVMGGGTITGLFSVLVDGDDHNEPIADAVRGLLDGHIVLDRSLAERGLYPAVNVLKSISRLASTAQTKHQKDLVLAAKKILATYDDMAELIRLGAYTQGSNPDVDEAIRLYPAFTTFFSQKPHEHTSLSNTFAQLELILEG